MFFDSWSRSARNSPWNPGRASADVGHRHGAMPPRSGTKSELEAQTELHDARIVRPIQYQEPAASRVGRCRQSLRRRATHRAGSSGATHTWICAADGIELRVIEGIKGFPAEF